MATLLGVVQTAERLARNAKHGRRWTKSMLYLGGVAHDADSNSR